VAAFVRPVLRVGRLRADEVDPLGDAAGEVGVAVVDTAVEDRDGDALAGRVRGVGCQFGCRPCRGPVRVGDTVGRSRALSPAPGRVGGRERTGRDREQQQRPEDGENDEAEGPPGGAVRNGYHRPTL
jgi:hypothetical protein